MLEGKKKERGRACSANINFPFWNCFCIKEKSTLHREKYLALDPGLWWQSTGKLMTPLSQFGKLLTSSVGGMGWSGAARKGDPSLGCPPLLTPTMALADWSTMVSLHVTLFLIHLFLCLLLDSPSSGDDEDDDDESEDTGNLSF